MGVLTAMGALSTGVLTVVGASVMGVLTVLGASEIGFHFFPLAFSCSVV